MYQYEQAQQLSVSLLTKWLVKYKFKDQNVTNELRKSHAKAIAEKLGNPELWHSHARGISMEILQQDMELEIEDFGKTEN